MLSLNIWRQREEGGRGLGKELRGPVGDLLLWCFLQDRQTTSRTSGQAGTESHRYQNYESKKPSVR